MTKRRRRTIIIDSREQQPYRFHGRTTKVRKLDVGDYSLEGFTTGGVVVERKSFNDLFHTFTRRRDAILRQIRRMGSEFRMAALVIEATPAMVADGHDLTRVSGSRLLETVLLECADAGVLPIFAGGRGGGRIATEAFLLAFERMRDERR